MVDYKDLIIRLEGTADKFEEVINGATTEALTKRPDEKNWAPVEIICHMRDVEELFFHRFQTMLVVDELTFHPVDVDRWAEDRQYLRNDALEALSAFRKQREQMLAFLKTLSPGQWERSSIHPKRGRMTIADGVALMTNHDTNHLQQLNTALGLKS
ncbi:MAG: DinB family protein [Deltaproteobacteria bacterium]|nr:DinB family protein [Deltaproteobacteria bacterium]MBW1960740.1 DinB family protein [Deltaproteobacteria bacterium]MBW1993644.1 DinB family protein [Deltaproteobacteria bacterium]MBW2152612.1 DinB family protein [Deltaproteobacteria bacterium]